MILRTSNLYPLPKLDAATHRSLLACGLWLRAGFGGASVAIIGFVRLFEGEPNPLSALALISGGAALAALAWRRAHAALRHTDLPAATTSESPARDAARTPAAA